MDVEIGRIRVRCIQSHGETDTLLLRLRLTHLLESAELHTAPLPPAAILVVRHLTTPLPAPLAQWATTRIRHRRWERVVRQTLAETYRRAARPSQGYVPASAEAVLFADEGEMLACLALDMSRGTAAEHWWWHSLLRTLPSPSAAGLTTLLCRRAASLPAALHHLAERGQVVTVVEALAPQQAMAVLCAMGQAYEMTDWHPSLTQFATFAPAYLTQTPERGGREQVARGHAGGVQPEQPTTAPAHAIEPLAQSAATALPVQTMLPWTGALVPAHLGKERACLLGLGLTLYDCPAMTRSRAFLSRLRAWWIAQDMVSPPTVHPARWPQHQEIGVRERGIRDEAKPAPVLKQAAPSAPQLSMASVEETSTRQMAAQGIDALPHAADPRTGSGSQPGERTKPVYESTAHMLRRV